MFGVGAGPVTPLFCVGKILGQCFDQVIKSSHLEHWLPLKVFGPCEMGNEVRRGVDAMVTC